MYVHKLECFVKRLLYSKSRSQWRLGAAVNVFTEQYLWSNKLNMVVHRHEPENHMEIFFRYFQGQGHSHFHCIFRSTETFTTQISLMMHHHKTGLDTMKINYCFYSGWERMWPGWLWTRLLPLLAILISQAGVNTSSSQENVDRTLLL